MNSLNLNQINSLSLNPSNIEYFWHMLPFAYPGIITFLVAIILGGLSLYSGIKKVEKKELFLSFSLFCLGCGSLGLIMAFRAVVQDKVLLLKIHHIVFFFVMLFTPGFCHFLHVITEKRYKPVKVAIYLCWVTIAIGVVGIFLDRAFLPSFHEYPFGLFPQSDIFLKPWGAVITAGFLFIGLPYSIHHLRKHPDKETKPLIFGVVSICALIFTTAPSFFGIPIYPLSSFIFLPLLLLAYGVFKSDFLSMNDFLFEQKGFFIILCTILSIAFIIMAFLAAYGFNKLSDIPHISNFIVPFLSLFVCFALAIFSAGLNPKDKSFEYLGASLASIGFFLLALLTGALRLDPIINLRFQQVAYFFMMLLLVFKSHLINFTIKNKTLSKFLSKIDWISIILSAFCFTNWIFKGYYDGKWGYIFAWDTLGSLIFLWFIFVEGFLLFQMFQSKEVVKKSLLKVLAIATSFTLAIFCLQSLSIKGFEVFPAGYFLIIPALIFCYGVIKHGSGFQQGRSLRLSRRIAGMNFIVLPIAIFLFYPYLSGHIGHSQAQSYLLLAFGPLVLFGFLLLFILSRPIADQMDKNIESLESAHRSLTEAYKELHVTQSQLIEAEKMSSIGVMVAGVAHEINNPLGAMIFANQNIGEFLNKLEIDNERIKGKIELNLEKQAIAGERILRIVKGLREYTRPDREQAEKANIKRLLDTSHSVIITNLNNVEVDYKCDEYLIFEVFPSKLSQVICNLIVNAAQALKDTENPQIYVKAQQLKSKLIITVLDNGPGIPEKIRNKIFDPFFTTKQVGEGTGLGLALCKKYIQEMDGQLTVESEPGKTEFKIEI